MPDLIFTADDISDLRALSLEFLPDDWQLQAPASVDDSQGGYVTTWTTIASGSAATKNGGRLEPAGYQAREQILAERPQAIGAYTILLPHGTPVEAHHRVVMGGRSFYLTGSTPDAIDSWSVYVQVGAAEVR